MNPLDANTLRWFSEKYDSFADSCKEPTVKTIYRSVARLALEEALWLESEARRNG